MDTDKIRNLLDEIERCNHLAHEIRSSSQTVALQFNMDGTIDVDDGTFTFEASQGAHIREDLARYFAEHVNCLKAQISQEAAS